MITCQTDIWIMVWHLGDVPVNKSIPFEPFRSIWTQQQGKKLRGTWKSATWPVSTRLRVRSSRWWKKTRTGAFWSRRCSSTCLSHAGTRNPAAWRGQGPLLRLARVSCLTAPKAKAEIFLRLRLQESVHFYEESERVQGEGLSHWSKHSWSNTRNSK